MRGIHASIVGLAVLAAAVAASLSPASTDDLVLANASERLREHVGWALSLFDAHGLEPPTVSSITFDPHDPLCDRFAGYFWASESSVLLCFDAATMRLGDDSRLHDLEARALVHELAHAWTQEHTTHEQRAAFTRAMGARSWNDPQDSWYHRGTELAADGFVCVLTEGELCPPLHASRDRDELATALAILTRR